MSIHPLIAAGIPESVLIGVIVVVVLLFSLLLVALSRYRRCPSDKIMVIYGKVGQNKDGSARSARCIHGGAAMVWPVIQAYEYLDLTPLSISVDLKSALSRQNIRIDVPARFTVGISTEPGTMQNAAERLLGLKLSEIQELSKDIIFGQMRLIIATMDIEEINTDRDKFLAAVSACVESELRKIGLRLINVNVTDISDESGYIEALGKEAAAKAINEARISVAEQNREGSIGEANAVRDQRISVAAANASAVDGENTSKANVAKSDATRREQEAEALRRAVTAEKLAEAKASRLPKRRVPPASLPPSKPISSSRRRLKKRSACWKPKPKPKRHVGWHRVKRTLSLPKWLRRHAVCRSCSASRLPVLRAWSRRQAAIPTQRFS